MALCSSELKEAVPFVLKSIGREGITLREQQVDCICHVYNGKDVFACLPTGFGKSMIYESLPFVFDYKFKKCSPTVSAASFLLFPLSCL